MRRKTNKGDFTSDNRASNSVPMPIHRALMHSKGNNTSCKGVRPRARRYRRALMGSNNNIMSFVNA